MTTPTGTGSTGPELFHAEVQHEPNCCSQAHTRRATRSMQMKPCGSGSYSR